MFIIKQSTPNRTLDRHVYVRGALFQFRIIYTKNRTWKLYVKMYNLRSDDTEKEMKKRNLVEINISRLAWAYF